MPGDRAHELRVARVVAQRAPDRPHGLAEGAVRDDDVSPDAVEDLLAGDRSVPLGEEQHEQIEVARDHRHVGIAAAHLAVRGRDEKDAESIPRQGHAPSIVLRKRVQGFGVQGWSDPALARPRGRLPPSNQAGSGGGGPDWLLLGFRNGEGRMRAARSGRSVGVLALAAWLVLSVAVPAGPVTAPAALPERLSDAEFWRIVTDFSEPGGFFRITDNFTSNEREIGVLFTMLRAANVKGGVYMGVGPEQNLTYIAAIRPAMAFIIDIRRQAVMQHLMFKAVFEMSKDRADFISLLFSKPRPAALDSTTPIQKIWDAFLVVPTDAEMGAKTYGRITELLTKTKGFTLTPDEMSQLDLVYKAFQVHGPGISTRGGAGGNTLTFADLTGFSAGRHW